MSETKNVHFECKAGTGILLNYFSIYINNLKGLYSSDSELRSQINAVCVSGTAAMGMFSLLGSSDVLILGVSDDHKKLNDMQTMEAYRNIKGVLDFHSHYATIVSVYPAPFDFDETVKECPIIGTVFVKFRDEVWNDTFPSAYDMFRSKLSAKFESMLKEVFPGGNGVRAALAFSYGVEDCIIVLFGNSFERMKRFVTRVRELELKDITVVMNAPPFKHAIVSTTTILGMHTENIGKFPEIQNDEDRINWSILLSIRPGHMNYAQGVIAGKTIEQKAVPIVGRNDLIIHPMGDMEGGETISEFQIKYSKIITNIMDDPAFLSMETYLSFPKLSPLESNESAGDPKNTCAMRQNIVTLTDLVMNSENINDVERESFIQVLRKMEFLLSDRYFRDSFLTLAYLVETGVSNYLNLPPAKRDSDVNVLMFSTLVEVCYATRYHGEHPVGETAVNSTLGYYTVGSEVLVMFDYLSNLITGRLCKKYTNASGRIDGFVPLCIVTTNIASTTSTVNHISALRTAFIKMPPRPLFRHDVMLVTFFHELGHVLVEGFLNLIELSHSTNHIAGIYAKFRDEEKKNELTFLAAIFGWYEHLAVIIQNDIREKYTEIWANILAAKVVCDMDLDIFEVVLSNTFKQYYFKSTTSRCLQNYLNAIPAIIKEIADNPLGEISLSVSDMHKVDMINHLIFQMDGAAQQLRDNGIDDESIMVSYKNVFPLLLDMDSLLHEDINRIKEDVRTFRHNIVNLDSLPFDEIRAYYKSGSGEDFWKLWAAVMRQKADAYKHLNLSQ